MIDTEMREKFEAIMDDVPEEVVFAKSFPIFPHVKVRLVGEDGNAWAITARVTQAMKRAKIRQEVRDYFVSEALSGDYDHLLRTVLKYVNDLPPIGCTECGEVPPCSCEEEWEEEYE